MDRVFLKKLPSGKYSTAVRFIICYFCFLSHEKLHGFVDRSGNNVVLLFFRKFDEVYSIPGNTNGELRILFRVRLRVQKGFTVEYVYVQVMTTVAYVAV